MTESVDTSAVTTAPSSSDAAARLTRQDWLNMAIATLLEGGIDQVKIQVMAQKLNVARSSFYWHFKDHRDLLNAILDEWLKVNTGPIIEHAKLPAPDAVQAVINIFECWIDNALFNPQLDIAIRLWARQSPVVKKVVRQADTLRTDALTKMFERYGMAHEEALIRARVLYFTQIGQYTLEFEEDPQIRFSHGPAYLHIFTGTPPGTKQIADYEKMIEDRVFSKK